MSKKTDNDIAECILKNVQRGIFEYYFDRHLFRFTLDDLPIAYYHCRYDSKFVIMPATLCQFFEKYFHDSAVTEEEEKLLINAFKDIWGIEVEVRRDYGRPSVVGRRRRTL